jgi:hypothetical protein
MPHSFSRNAAGQSRSRRHPEISCTTALGREDAAFEPEADVAVSELAKRFRCPTNRRGAPRENALGVAANSSMRLLRFWRELSVVCCCASLIVPEASESVAFAPGRQFAPCPLLPAARPGLDWKALHAFRDADRGADFYLACLEYGQALWQRGLAARALLCLDRAFGADLRGDEAILDQAPLPYAATAWIIGHTPPDVFIGNPRVHFQHYAGRMNEPRKEQRQARAWACWALTRVVRPELPGDPKHRVHEPTEAEIESALRRCGHSGEAELWRAVFAAAPGYRPSSARR